MSFTDSRSEKAHLSIVPPAEAIDSKELKGKRAVTLERLMNACAAIIVSTGFRSVSMTAIAEQTALTRQTVYRYFANSDEAVEATLRRAWSEVLEAQYLVYREEGEPSDLIVRAVLTTLRLITTNVLLVKALGSNGNPRAFFLSTLPLSLSERAVQELKQIGDRVGWDEQDCREVNEVMARWVNSFLSLPATDPSEAAVRSFLEKRLIPSLGL